MTTTEHQILAEIATTGQAVIQLFKPREAKAAETLRSQRIIYIEAGNDLIWWSSLAVHRSATKPVRSSKGKHLFTRPQKGLQ